MAKLVWTTPALEELQRCLGHIACEAPEAAQKLKATIERRAKSLRVTPLIGRVVPGYGRPDVREIYVQPFRVIYQVVGPVCKILTVVHGKRDLPAIFQPPPLEEAP